MRITGQVTRVCEEESTGDGRTFPPRIFFRPSNPADAKKPDTAYRYASGELALPVSAEDLDGYKVGDDVTADFKARKFVERGESVVTDDPEVKPKKATKSKRSR